MRTLFVLAALSIAAFQGVAELRAQQPGAKQAPKSAPKPSPKTTVRPAPPKPAEKAAEPAADVVAFPAIGVKLVRPKGFADGKNFHGFQLEESLASLMAVSMPAPFAEISKGLNADTLKTRGIQLVSSEPLEVEGRKGLLLNLKQSAQGIDFEKWILVFGDEKKSTMLTATFPAQERDALSAMLKQTVVTVKLDDTPPPAPGADLPFTLTPSDKLKVTPGLQKALTYTKDGVVPLKSQDDPLMVVAPSLGKVDIEDKRAFALRRLTQTASFKLNEVVSNTPITIDGLEGFETYAEGEHAQKGTPVSLYQMVLFQDGEYILLVGMVGTAAKEAYLPEFKATAHSLRRRAAK